MQALNELLSEKSFETISFQDITDRATLNRATFYAHFTDKNALLDYVAKESFKQALSSRMPAEVKQNDITIQLLIQIVCEYLELVLFHCQPSKHTSIDTLIEQQVKQQLYEMLMDWYDNPGLQGLPTQDNDDQDDRDLRSTAATWAIYGLTTRWSQGDRKESAADFARRALPLIKAGLEMTLKTPS